MNWSILIPSATFVFGVFLQTYFFGLKFGAVTADIRKLVKDLERYMEKVDDHATKFYTREEMYRAKAERDLEIKELWKAINALRDRA